MVTTRNTRQDVIAAAGRLFAEYGYHGTSMRDLGRELGLLGSSLYSHIESKQDLLVAVVEQAAELFQNAAERALVTEGTAADRLGSLIAGHVDVVVDNLDVARTFLNEARALDGAHRSRVLEARDGYERVFRAVLDEGVRDGSLRKDLDPRIDGIFVLSVLNAVERWYDPQGHLDRDALVAMVTVFVLNGVT